MSNHLGMINGMHLQQFWVLHLSKPIAQGADSILRR